MGFAHVFYNRICSSIEGDYEPILEMPTITSRPTHDNSDIAATGLPAEDRLDTASFDIGTETDEVSNPDRLSNSRTRIPMDLDARAQKNVILMSRLCTAITPHQKPTVKPGNIFSDDGWRRYVEAADKKAKDQMLWLAQMQSAVRILRELGRYG